MSHDNYKSIHRENKERKESKNITTKSQQKKVNSKRGQEKQKNYKPINKMSVVNLPFLLIITSIIRCKWVKVSNQET